MYLLHQFIYNECTCWLAHKYIDSVYFLEYVIINDIYIQGKFCSINKLFTSNKQSYTS